VRSLSTTLATTLVILSTSALSAQTELRPAPSGRATSEVVLTKPVPMGSQEESGPEFRLRLDHGQPHLRGRTLHTDALVPYGTPWRTGANAATTLTTEVDLELAGVMLPAGRYVLFTLPEQDGWTLLVQRDIGQESSYDAANDLARIPLRMRTLSAPLESLSMWLIPSTAPESARGELRMAWGYTELSADWLVK
jgi:hypothetical protein